MRQMMYRRKDRWQMDEIQESEMIDNREKIGKRIARRQMSGKQTCDFQSIDY